MIESFFSLQDLLIQKVIKISNEHLCKVLEDFVFVHFSEKTDISQNGFKENIKKSKVIVINQYKNDNQEVGNTYYIIVFEKTIMLIDNSSIPFFNQQFTNKSDICIVNLTDTKDILNKDIFEEIKIDLIFKEEIRQFIQQFPYTKKKPISTNIIKLWKCIQYSLSSYLIQQSYQNLNKNRINDLIYKNDQKNEPIILNRNDYITLQVFGIGSSFYAELIYHIERRELFVIKKINNIDQDNAKLIQRQLKNYSKIDNPFIARFIGMSEDNKSLIVEFIDGEILSNIKNNLSENLKFTILFELMLAIECIHHQNLIYRDLKPDNIMIDKSKTLVLVDFDRMINESDINSKDFTADLQDIFAAPEINTGKYSSKCDIYSIGQIMNYMLKLVDYPAAKKIFIKCTNKNENERPTILELIIDFYINFHSQIEIDHFFKKNEEHFSQKMDNDLLKALIDLENGQDNLEKIRKIIELKREFAIDITEECRNLVKNVDDVLIQNLYSKFSFKYWKFDSTSKNSIKSYLQNYLNDRYFIVYECLENSISIPFLQIQENLIPQNLIDVILCVENECIIIKQIEKICFNEVLSETIGYIINTNLKTCDNESLKEEISSITKHYQYLFDENNFFKCTINSIAGYKIRRYFYPSFIFEDQSFFKFNKTSEYSNEDRIQSNLYDIIIARDKEEMNEKLQQFRTQLNETLINSENNFNLNTKINEFKPQDFHVLRKIHDNFDSSLTLVIHVQSLYIFVCKNINPQYFDDFKHEIDFDSKYSHRCLTQFYGFVKDQNKIVGLIYEFMSNGSLLNYIDSKYDQNDDSFSFQTVIRIFEGIKYLHSQNLIHRDIKPSNILLDHNLLPYISGFKYVRYLENEDYIEEKLTYDFSSLLYASPEQFFKETISFSTDIYSFGVLLYFIFEKKNMIPLNEGLNSNEIYDLIRDGNLPEMLSVSSSIQFIYLSCVIYEPDRMSLEDIEMELENEINSFYYIENYLKNENIKHKKVKLVQYLKESIIFQSQNLESIQTFMKNILNIDFFSFFLFMKDYSMVLFNIGDLYYKGKIVQQNYSTAKEYFELSADLNNTDAYMFLGFLYLYGQGVSVDYSKALKYFELAADLNNVYAFANIGILYASGKGVEKDDNKADEYFEKVVQLNDPCALNLIGNHYFNDEKDYKKAKKFFDLSAKHNFSDAQFNLGIFYYHGFGVEKDIAKAKEYFELAAQQDQPGALFTLGTLYLNGDSVPKNISKAIDYFEKSAQFDDLNALMNLGGLYLFGQDVPKDVLKAMKYYEKAAELNCSDAYLTLGQIYNNGIGCNKDSKKGLEYIKKSASLNNITAQYNLGKIYMDGIIVQKNYNEARKYFELAAEKNDVLSQYNLGVIYFNGFAGQQDFALAKHYFELAAKQNHSDSLFFLGCFYYMGIGVSPDISKSINCFTLSAQQNNQNACIILANIYSEGKHVQKDINKVREYIEKSGLLNNINNLLNVAFFFSNNGDYENAIYYFDLSAKHNNPSAITALGFIYLNGYGVQKNVQKAVEYFELAAKMNEQTSITQLGKLYFFGEEIPKDNKKAKEYLEKAAKYNNPLALFYLGNLYLEEKNDSKSKEYFKQYYDLAHSEDSTNVMQFYIAQNILNPSKNVPTENNLSTASFSLGFLYYNGFGVEQDFVIAKKYFEFAAKQLNSNACVYLGNMYYFGNGVEMSFVKAKEYYEMAAKDKNKESYKKLAVLYYYGKGVEQSYQLSRVYLELAAELNDILSIDLLGNLYLNGEGVKQDYSKAKEYFEKAAKLNDQIAFNCLGYIYLNGLGVDKNYSKAKEYFEKGAEMENPISIHCLACLYFYGLGVEQNFSKAKTLFESIKNDYPPSLNSLGTMHVDGIGVEKDILKARYYFELASKQDYLTAYYNLGCLYYNDVYGMVDYKKAFEYFKKAADQDHSYALLGLGNMYLLGLSVDKNYQKAIQCFELALKFGNCIACLDLSDIYLNGIGVNKNFKKGIYFLVIAAENNIPDALYKLGYIFYSCEFVDKDIPKAVSYFQKCINISDDQFFLVFQRIGLLPYLNRYNLYKYYSYNYLGLIYLTVYNRIEEAGKYMKESAFNRFPFSQNNLGLMYQFYFNQIENAIHMFNRASEQKFALAEYNLGFLDEKENRIEDAVNHYKKASEYQNQSLVFLGKEFTDRKLIISMTFIICYTDLKLTNFYLSKSDYEESRKYFIKSLSKLIFTDIYPFHFKFNKDKIEESFSYIKNFIFSFPLFDFESQKILSLKDFEELNNEFFKESTKSDETKGKDENKGNKSNFSSEDKKLKQSLCVNSYDKAKLSEDEKREKVLNEKIIGYFEEENNQPYDFNSQYHINSNEDQLNFEDPGELFDFVIKNDEIKSIFIIEINEIIKSMKEILYKPPYFILFGAINIRKFKMKQQLNPFMKDINQLFYEGFGLEK